MARLDIERQEALGPKRIEYAVKELQKRKLLITKRDDKMIQFNWLGSIVTLFPYSGWHSGKTVKDGRGINKLLKQIDKMLEG